MEAVVHQPLRHVVHLDARVAFHLAQIDDALVRDEAVLALVEDGEVRVEPARHVVGVEDGDLARALQAGAAHHLDVRPADEQDRRAPPRRRAHRADGLLAAGAHHRVAGQVRREVLRRADGAHPRAAAAVRDAERFM